jgi:hypothetical protein
VSGIFKKRILQTVERVARDDLGTIWGQSESIAPHNSRASRKIVSVTNHYVVSTKSKTKIRAPEKFAKNKNPCPFSDNFFDQAGDPNFSLFLPRVPKRDGEQRRTIKEQKQSAGFGEDRVPRSKEAAAPKQPVRCGQPFTG